MQGEGKKQSKQIKALFMKNLKIQYRQPCTNICQIVTPVICLVFTVLIRNVAIANLPTDKDTIYNIAPFVPFKFNNYTYEDMAKQFIYRSCQQWFTYKVQNSEDLQFIGTRNGTHKSGMLKMIANNYAFECPYNISKSQPFDIQFMRPPIFRSQEQSINSQLMQDYNYYNNQTFDSLIDTSANDKMPDAAVSFKHVNNQSIKADIKINDLRTLQYHRPDGVTRIRFFINKTEQFQSYYTVSQGLLSFIQMLNNAYMKKVHEKDMESGAVYMPILTESSVGIDILISTISSFLFPLSLSLLLPVFLYLIVLEKQQKLIQMMRMNGMKMRYYWSVNFIFSFILSILTNLVFCLVGYFFLQNSIFSNVGWDVLIVVLLGWILSQIGLATFLQVFLASSQAANIIGYLFSIWSNLIGATLSVAIFQFPVPLPPYLSLFPAFAFNRIFYLMFTDCSNDHCYTSLQMIPHEVRYCITVLYGSFIIFQLLGMYLYEVIPQQFGTTQPFLFPFKFITSRCKKDREPKLNNQGVDAQNNDQEAKQERNKIINIQNVKEHALICNGLRKVYDNKKVAVSGANLVIEDNQIFGLLGPNGAGKTTLISMITGIFQPTKGQAFVGGFSIISDIEKVHLEMGVCPQFDILWPQLTVEEHLYFYTRLRGTSSSKEKETVERALEQVNLTPFKSFKSTQLSGGMKRRLSIGISMVGNPRIIFLDEPTTGLDPQNRRNIWEVLSKCKEKRSLFLTTHLMEQAQTLCNRIGIITDGVLRTVGTELKLKKIYGSGYYLSINLDIQRKREEKLRQNVIVNSVVSNEDLVESLISEPEEKMFSNLGLNETMVKKSSIEDVGKVKDTVQKLFPECVLKKQINGYLRFSLGDIVISEVMEKLNESRDEIKKGWGLSSSTLEDVFMEVVRKYEKDTQTEESQQPAPEQILQKVEESLLED